MQQKQGELTQTESDFFYDLQYLSGQLPRELKDLESEYPGQDLKSLTICMEELGKSIESLIQSTLGFYKNLKENPTSEEAKKAFALHLGNFAEFTGLYKQYKQHIDILVKEKPKIHRHNAKKKGAAEKTITIPKKTSELPIKHPEMPAPDPNKMASNSLLSFDSSLLKPVQRVLKYPLLFKEIIQESKDDEREAWYTLEAKAKSTAETINEMHRMNQQHFFNLCLEGMSVITKQDRSGQELLKLMRQAKTPEEKLKFSDSADMKNILQYFEKKSPDQYKLLQKNSLEFISKSELREAWQEYSHLDAKMQKAESGFSEHEMTLYRSQMLYVKEQLYQGDIQGVKNALKVAEVFFRSRELGIQIEELKQQCALLDVQLQALPDDKFKVAKGKGIAEILTSLNKATPTTVEVLSRLVAEIGEEINEHKELSSAMQLYATLKEKIDKATGADLYEAEMFYMQEKLAHAKENITRNDTPAALGFLQEIQKAFSEIERFKKLPSLSAQKTSRLSMRGVLGSLIQKVVSSLLRIGHPNKVSPEARDPALRASDTVLDVPDNRRSKTQPAGTPTQQIGGGPHDPSQLQQQKHTKTPVGFLPELQEVQKKRAEQQNQCPGTGGSDPDPRRRPDSQC